MPSLAEKTCHVKIFRHVFPTPILLNCETIFRYVNIISRKPIERRHSQDVDFTTLGMWLQFEFLNVLTQKRCTFFRARERIRGFGSISLYNKHKCRAIYSKEQFTSFKFFINSQAVIVTVTPKKDKENSFSVSWF